ncbi:MAG: hypothetical protein M1818_000937 [Claussenomyces sp. TS43310]|nr:MAG: hypothetical protein M1818_000937 [Claussenomyces sp. TS43310]
MATSVPTPHTIIDDKSPHCIPFILACLSAHQTRNSHNNDEEGASSSRPFIIGLNGVQGAGKTTLVSALSATLRSQCHLETLVCSIDDLYLTHADQTALAAHHASNPLVQHRGQPGTHDMELAAELFSALREGRETKVPQYDKSAIKGAGDRVPRSKWDTINGPGQPKVRVVIFEGWCVGFRSLQEEEVERKWKACQNIGESRLRRHRLEDLLFVNERLKGYDKMTETFEAFLHIDAQETNFVYEWRLEQEALLRKVKGTGMTDQQVTSFVDGYYPAYELFTDVLRKGIFSGRATEWKGRQLRLVIGRDRRVVEVMKI